MPLNITGVFAAALSFLLLFLMAALSNARIKNSVYYGDGGVPVVAYRMRAYGNFVETAPFAVILLAIMETLSTPNTYLYIAGIVLVCGRLLHAAYFLLDARHWSLRMLGTSLTMLMILVSALYITSHFLSSCDQGQY
jgi:uncharacterized membrane protein YecN with MAPEG domain